MNRDGVSEYTSAETVYSSQETVWARPLSGWSLDQAAAVSASALALSEARDTSVKLAIGLGVTFGVLGLASVGFCCRVMWRKRNRRPQVHQAEIKDEAVKPVRHEMDAERMAELHEDSLPPELHDNHMVELPARQAAELVRGSQHRGADSRPHLRSQKLRSITAATPS